MRRRGLLTLGAFSALTILVSSSASFALSTSDLVGSWKLVSNVTIAKNGTKTDVFGPNPSGVQIFGSDGRFAFIFTRSDLPRFASNNRMKGTPEENKAIVQGSLALFGTYSLDGNVLVQHVEGGMWPSFVGENQKRTISAPTKDTMTLSLSPPSGATVVATFSRMK